jgi:TusA-related sulfurtransferase
VGQRRGRAGGKGGCRHLTLESRGQAADDSSACLDLSDAEQLCTEPAPLEQVRRTFARLEPGARLEVRSRIAEHAFTVRAWSRKQGIQLVRDEDVGGVHVLVLVRGS